VRVNQSRFISQFELNSIGAWERARQPAGISAARQGKMSGFLLGELYNSERSERGNICRIIRIYMIIQNAGRLDEVGESRQLKAES